MLEEVSADCVSLTAIMLQEEQERFSSVQLLERGGKEKKNKPYTTQTIICEVKQLTFGSPLSAPVLSGLMASENCVFEFRAS